MDACGCDDWAGIFDRPSAERDRDRYRRSGPDRTTAMLLELLRPWAVSGTTLLDVGGGIGVLAHELLGAGARHAVLVDASTASIDVAREEAARTGVSDRLETMTGDFVRRAAEIDPADIVTLDRVVCCYGDADALVRLSASRAQRAYGLVLPRDNPLLRIGARVLNAWMWLRRRAYRSYVHGNRRIDELVAEAGLERVSEVTTLVWRVVVYARQAS